MQVTPTVSPPQRLGNLTKRLFVAQVESILQDLHKELERRSTAQRA